MADEHPNQCSAEADISEDGAENHRPIVAGSVLHNEVRPPG